MIGESLAVNTKRATILLLGSDPIVSAVFQETLEAHGYLVLHAGNLAAAVDWLGRTQPDLLIVRPYLQNIAGHDAALYLRTKCKGMRVLMVSGYLDDDRLQYREALHTIEVFPKPYTAAEFTQKVAEVLATIPSETAAAPSDGA